MILIVCSHRIFNIVGNLYIYLSTGYSSYLISVSSFVLKLKDILFIYADMSCQQVPRITEDPYTFTETTPTTGTLFNPQISKLSPLISTTSTVQRQIITTPKSQIITQGRLTPINQSSPQQFVATRINGASQTVNGIHKNVVGTNANINKSIPQLQYSTTKIVTTTPTKKFLPPPSPIFTKIYQTHPQYSIAKQTSIITTTSVPTTAVLPTHFQRNVIIAQGNSTSQIGSIKVSPKNHSNPSKSTVIGVSQPVSTGSAGVLQNIVGSVPANTGINRKTTPVKLSVPSEIKSNSENEKKKPLGLEKNLFLTPAKRDSRVLSSSGKKAKIQSSPNIRTKRSYSQTSHHETLQRISSFTSSCTSVNEWHAPDSYIFDNVSPYASFFNAGKCDNIDAVPCVQTHWLELTDIIKFIPTPSPLSRDQRIELRKAQLRRQAMQYLLSQPYTTQLTARKRLICVSKALRKFKDKEEPDEDLKNCSFPSCVNNALTLTDYCYLHITRNTNQYLFLPCTAKFSDNSQCRIPVFDISHELPLCQEHAWKRDNYNRIVQELKPKKPPRKRPKPSAMTRPQKRSKKKRKLAALANSNGVNTNLMTNRTELETKLDDVDYPLMQPLNSMITNQNLVTQDMLNICENSSAYESSEDTGVGGLSESELMVGPHDVIEEIPLGDTRLLEEHDLTNVLNQLPVDAFNELFTTVQQNGPLEPTQEEQEDLERALEAVNKQVKSLQQMTGGDSNFLGDFLDVDDQMLDDADICSDVLHSPDTSGIDTSNILVDGGSNSTGSCSTTTNPAEIRELVQT